MRAERIQLSFRRLFALLTVFSVSASGLNKCELAKLIEESRRISVTENVSLPLASLGRKVSFHEPVSIGRFSTSRKVELFEELRKKNIYADIYHHPTQSYWQGIPDSIQMNEAVVMKPHGFPIYMETIHSFMIRGRVNPEKTDDKHQLLPIHLKAELELSGAPAKALKQAKQKAHAVVTATEFFSSPKLQKFAKNAMGLGVARPQFYLYRKYSGLQEWEDFYTEHGIFREEVGEVPNNHTDIFMSQLFKQKNKVVFFVPRRIEQYIPTPEWRKKGFALYSTRNELRWLLKSEYLPKSILVFGAYDFITAGDKIQP